jgi:hypothetical protein
MNEHIEPPRLREAQQELLGAEPTAGAWQAWERTDRFPLVRFWCQERPDEHLLAQVYPNSQGLLFVTLGELAPRRWRCPARAVPGRTTAMRRRAA